MDLKKLVIIALIFLLIGIFSGCQKREATDVNTIPENIEFESDLLELTYANIVFHRDGDVVLRTEVQYLFKNIAKRVLNITVIAEFYDKNDKLLFTGGPKFLEYLPIDYVETEVFPPNTITYTGIDAKDVDHVKIIVTEV